MDINRFLTVMVDKGGSDMFFTTGAPVHMKIEGVTHALKMPALAPGQTRQIAQAIMTEAQAAEFAAELEMNLALTAPGIGRFRVNIFMQRGEVGLVIRHVRARIASIGELGLPSVLEQLVMRKRGLILVVGSTGSGKSTTLAAMINFRNRNASGHILTIEDPIEFLHEHQLSVVDQREVGIDTHSYEKALKNALREAPDVIMIGEIRDRATMQQALAFSETGHLCLSTLHANSADQAMERIVNFFPDDARQQMLQDLSANLSAVIGQRLVPGLREGRVAAIEVFLKTPYLTELIARGELANLKDVMKRGGEAGMQTFDQALFDLVAAGKISPDEALAHCDSRTDLSLRIRLTMGATAVTPGNISLRPSETLDMPLE